MDILPIGFSICKCHASKFHYKQSCKRLLFWLVNDEKTTVFPNEIFHVRWQLVSDLLICEVQIYLLSTPIKPYFFLPQSSNCHHHKLKFPLCCITYGIKWRRSIFLNLITFFHLLIMSFSSQTYQGKRKKKRKKKRIYKK